MAGRHPSGGPTVYDLVSKPFGPFHDSMILSLECKTTPTKPVSLRDVLLEYDGRPTGLTFCEHTQPESFHHDSEDGTPQRPVRLRGLLAIKNLDWLSDDGRDILTGELRKRDYNIRRRKRGANAKESNLTLANIFDSNGKLHNKRTYIKVIIQAIKEGPAVYMNSERAPGFLVIHTAHMHRAYRVLGMDVETYKRSHLFLSRYRVLHDLRTIHKLPSSKRTPITERTPEWFVSQYIEHLLHREDTEDDQDQPMDSDESDTEELYLPPNRRRRARHISRAEVLSLLAMHVGWLIQEQKKQRFDKFFDPSEWGRFEAEANKYRQKARLENLQWGTFRGTVTAFEEENDSSSSEDRMDIDEPSRRPRRQKGKTSAPVNRRHPAPRHSISPPEHASNAFLDDPETYEHHYDSDFTTDGSSSSISDSGSLDSCCDFHANDCTPDFPPEILVPPVMPHNGPWICPVYGCLYEIDLRRPNREQSEVLWPEEAEYISSSRWNVDASEIKECFAKLVSKHYEDHLAECGLTLVKKGEQSKFKSTTLRFSRFAHGQMPNSQATVVKEEDIS